MTELKHGCECLENDPHVGLPKTAITPKIVKKKKKTHDTVMHGLWLKAFKTAKNISISDEITFHILTIELGMKILQN